MATNGELSGKPHSKGGVKAVVQSTGDMIELEGGEVVINKASVDSDEIFDFEGQPASVKEVLNHINTMDGNGDPIDVDAEASSYEQGGRVKKLHYDRYIPRDEIDEVHAIDGKVYRNSDWAKDKGDVVDILSGAYLSATKIRQRDERQMEMFNRGGYLDDAHFISPRKIDFIVTEDGEKINSDYIYSGLWFMPSDRDVRLKKEFKSMAKGGRVKDGFEQIADNPKNFPSELISLNDQMEDELITDGLEYAQLRDYVNRFENLGYTFDYDLDAEPYALRKIGMPLENVIGFNDQGFARGGKIKQDDMAKNKNWVQKVEDSPDFDEGGFSAAAKKRNLSTQELFNRVMKSPKSYPKKLHEQAIFMENAYNYKVTYAKGGGIDKNKEYKGSVIGFKESGTGRALHLGDIEIPKNSTPNSIVSLANSKFKRVWFIEVADKNGNYLYEVVNRISDDGTSSEAIVTPYARGGSTQGYDDREDESLGMRRGKESGKSQSDKARREDSYGKWGKRDSEKRGTSLGKGGNVGVKKLNVDVPKDFLDELFDAL